MYSFDHTMFFSTTGSVNAAQFAFAVKSLQPKIGGFSHVCNLYQDRLRFSLTLAAALLNGQTTVLPPSDAPEAISASLVGAVNPIYASKATLPIEYPAPIARSNSVELDPETRKFFCQLAASQSEIGVFTSGTTKRPDRIAKTWSILNMGATVTKLIIDHLDASPDKVSLLGTTPPRHMFGLEANVFATLGQGLCTYRETIFYPADLDAAVAAARAFGRTRIVLVTSPSHLRFLERTILKTPEICCVLSATAPLSVPQAERLEARGDLRVMEIYGSTETGSMAFRRTSKETAWTIAAGLELRQHGEFCVAHAPHLPDQVILGDEVELKPNGQFMLLGRKGDTVSIRGKRNHLSALNAILAEAPDLSDATYLHVKAKKDDQLAIAVVPGDQSVDDSEIKKHTRIYLLKHFDPAFVPKRVLVLNRIPRTPTGKISSETYQALAAKAGIG